MDDLAAIDALTALAQSTRLDAFRYLLKAYPGAISAGDIARHCDVPHNTLSTHLTALARAGLVTVARSGRAMNYTADLDGFRSLLRFLTRDCCKGKPEICAPLWADLDPCGTRQSKRISS